MKLALYLAAAFLALSGAFALQEVTVASGQSIRVSDTILATDPIEQLTTTYRILGTDYEEVFSSRNPRSAIVSHTLLIDVAPGTYVLEATYDINEGIRKRTELLLHVTQGNYGAPAYQPSKTGGQKTSTAPFIFESGTVIIPAIPDVTPGETIVLPVTIKGKGTYTIEIPKLTFATYEAPLTVIVDGERTLPVLVHIDSDATPGTYVIPVRVNGDESDVRVRIIKYRSATPLWPLLFAGLVLVIIGAVLIALATSKRKEQGRGRIAPPNEPELITYY
jgi:hypothetical protein